MVTNGMASDMMRRVESGPLCAATGSILSAIEEASEKKSEIWHTSARRLFFVWLYGVYIT